MVCSFVGTCIEFMPRNSQPRDASWDVASGRNGFWRSKVISEIAPAAQACAAWAAAAEGAVARRPMSRTDRWSVPRRGWLVSSASRIFSSFTASFEIVTGTGLSCRIHGKIRLASGRRYWTLVQ